MSSLCKSPSAANVLTQSDVQGWQPSAFVNDVARKVKEEPMIHFPSWQKVTLPLWFSYI